MYIGELKSNRTCHRMLLVIALKDGWNYELPPWCSSDHQLGSNWRESIAWAGNRKLLVAFRVASSVCAPLSCFYAHFSCYWSSYCSNSCVCPYRRLLPCVRRLLPCFGTRPHQSRFDCCCARWFHSASCAFAFSFCHHRGAWRSHSSYSWMLCWRVRGIRPLVLLGKKTSIETTCCRPCCPRRKSARLMRW